VVLRLAKWKWRADYHDEYVNGTEVKKTQLWVNHSLLYVFVNFVQRKSDSCYHYNMSWLGMLRPDAFAHDPSTKYVGRERVNGRWGDHFSAEDGGFQVWQNFENNFPIRDSGDPSDPSYTENNFDNVKAGPQKDYLFNFPYTNCPEHTMSNAMLATLSVAKQFRSHSRLKTA